jgi:hypothetical protein
MNVRWVGSVLGLVLLTRGVAPAADGTVVEVLIGDPHRPAPTAAERIDTVRVIRSRLAAMAVPTSDTDEQSLRVEDRGGRRVRFIFADHYRIASLQRMMTTPAVITFRTSPADADPPHWQIGLTLQAGDVTYSHATIDEEPAVLHLRLGPKAASALGHLTQTRVGARLGIFLDDHLLVAMPIQKMLQSGEIAFSSTYFDSDAVMVQVAHFMALDPLPQHVTVVSIKQ